MKTYLINIFILFFAMYFYSCECGPDVRLGESFITEQSKLFIPYTGSERLVFIDQDGIEYELESIEGMIHDTTRLITRELCNENPFDIQDEYYLSDRYNLYFYEENMRWPTIEIRLEQVITTEDTIVMDILRLNAQLDSISVVGYIETDNRGSSLPLADYYYDEMIFIGDTTLFNQSYQELYKSEVFYDGGYFYYDKIQGLVAIFYDDGNKYWRLDRIL